MGYAIHDAVLFGPWHRAFLSGYEQLMVDQAIAIADQYSGHQKQNYMLAAQSLRIPYWDWAIHAVLPAAVTDPNLQVNTPWGQQTVRNPFAAYQFHPHPSEQQFPASDGVSNYPKTVRTPDSNGQSQNDVINKILSSNADSLLDKAYLLIARQNNYTLFSNTGVPEKERNGQLDSLESVHNMVHGLVGAAGHMGYIPYSAFDPIFFMHHCNIDRLLAIWSAINPDSYVIPQPNPHGSYAEQPGTMEDVNTPLTPFHRNDNGEFHTAATTRDTFNLGYTYPEIKDWNNIDSATLAANTRRAFNDLYNPTGSLSKRNEHEHALREQLHQHLPIAHHARRDVLSNLTSATNMTSAPREWYINLSVQRGRTPFYVNFFLGTPPANEKNYATAANFIVSQPVLPDMMMMTPVKPSLSQIPLTRSLVKVGLDPSDVEAVVAYLKSSLQWRVSSVDADVAEGAVGKVEGLKVGVVEQVVELTPSQSDFHIYGPLVEHEELKW